jgi:menaquinol-cytochrome c reductase iron-sulfur subunit
MEPSHDQPAAPAGAQTGRRSLFRWLTLGLSAFATVVLAIPFVGYLFGMRKRPIEWLSLGPVRDFPPDETRLVTFVNLIRQPWDGLTAHIGVFVRRQGDGSAEEDRFLVLAANCAHLGCPVSWFPQSGLFMCPCHGGVYYASGERAAGPPPRGLFRCVHRVRGGNLEIQAPHYPTLQDTLDQPA